MRGYLKIEIRCHECLIETNVDDIFAGAGFSSPYGNNAPHWFIEKGVCVHSILVEPTMKGHSVAAAARRRNLTVSVIP